jgi:hypothetical protein
MIVYLVSIFLLYNRGTYCPCHERSVHIPNALKKQEKWIPGEIQVSDITYYRVCQVSGMEPLKG